MEGTLPEVEEETQIYICDINPKMLSVGKKRAADRGNNYNFHLLSNIIWSTCLLINCNFSYVKD